MPETENEGGSHENCEEKFAEIMNSVLAPPLQASDIVRAHRVGRRTAGKARPLIARLLRSTDKTRILQSRKELKDKNVGVSSDLTVRQRAELKQARSDGYFAYFRGGVLHTEERRQQPSDRPWTRSYSRAFSATGSVG